MICEWDPFNAVIVSEVGGKVAMTTFSRTSPTASIPTNRPVSAKDHHRIEGPHQSARSQYRRQNGQIVKTYALPVGAHLMVDDGALSKAGEIFVKIPRAAGSAGDITGGLPV